MTEPRADLKGRTILIVEDEYLLASELDRELRRSGATVLGPVASVDKASAALASQRPDAAVIDAILAMSHALGMRVSAEGVETLEQVDYLSARGCDEAQGFYYGEGTPLVEVAARTNRLVPSPHPATTRAEG